MKIKINEYETYEINLPDEINASRFLEVVSRLNHLTKLISKESAEDIIKENIIHRIRKPRQPRLPYRVHKEELKTLRNNRDMVVKIFKAYYSQNKEDFMRVIKELGMDNYITERQKMANAHFAGLKEFHNIKPEEVGLKAYPLQGAGGNLDKLRL